MAAAAGALLLDELLAAEPDVDFPLFFASPFFASPFLDFSLEEPPSPLAPFSLLDEPLDTVLPAPARLSVR